MFAAPLALASCGDSPSAIGHRAVTLDAHVVDTLRADVGYALGQPVGAAVDARGRYVVADGSDKDIKVYGPRGAQQIRVGRPGSGPGEFTALLSGGMLGDSIFGFDFAGARLSIFAPDGRYARAATMRLPSDPMPAQLRPVDDSLFLAVGFTAGAHGKELLTLLRPDGSRKARLFERRDYFEGGNADLVQSSPVVADAADGVVFAALMGTDSLFAFDYHGDRIAAGRIELEGGVALPRFRELIEANGGSRLRPDRSLITESEHALVGMVALPDGRAVLQVSRLDYGGQGRLDRTDGGIMLGAVADRASGTIRVGGDLELHAGLQGRGADGSALAFRYVGDDYERIEITALEVNSSPRPEGS